MFCNRLLANVLDKENGEERDRGHTRRDSSSRAGGARLRPVPAGRAAVLVS